MHDVIIRNYEIKVNGWKKGEPYIWLEEGGEEISSFDRMCGGSKKGEKMTKKRRENEEKMEGK